MYLPSDLNIRFARSYWWAVGFVGAAFVLFQLSDAPTATKILRLLLSYNAAVRAQTLIGLLGLPVGGVGIYAFVQWLRAYNRRQRKDRGQAMRRAAETLKYQFSDEPPPALAPFIRAFTDLRKRGLPSNTEFKGDQSLNFVTARAGDELVAVFDYEVSVECTDSERQPFTFFETVYLIVSDRLDLPYFQTQPESLPGGGLIDSLPKRHANISDVNFPSHSDFSGRYRLDADDVPRVKRLFTPAVLDFYKRNQLHRTGGNGKTLFFSKWRDTVLPDQNQIAINFNALHQLYQLLKSSEFQ